MGFFIMAPDGTGEFPYGTPAPVPAPQPVPTPLPPLTEVDCPRCQGFGYLEHADPMLSDRCDLCYGRTRIEVCSRCGEMPDVIGGVEACGCGSVLTEVVA